MACVLVLTIYTLYPPYKSNLEKEDSKLNI